MLYHFIVKTSSFFIITDKIIVQFKKKTNQPKSEKYPNFYITSELQKKRK